MINYANLDKADFDRLLRQKYWEMAVGLDLDGRDGLEPNPCSDSEIERRKSAVLVFKLISDATGFGVSVPAWDECFDLDEELAG